LAVFFAAAQNSGGLDFSQAKEWHNGDTKTEEINFDLPMGGGSSGSNPAPAPSSNDQQWGQQQQNGWTEQCAKCHHECFTAPKDTVQCSAGQLAECKKNCPKDYDLYCPHDSNTCQPCKDRYSCPKSYLCHQRCNGNNMSLKYRIKWNCAACPAPTPQVVSQCCGTDTCVAKANLGDKLLNQTFCARTVVTAHCNQFAGRWQDCGDSWSGNCGECHKIQNFHEKWCCTTKAQGYRHKVTLNEFLTNYCSADNLGTNHFDGTTYNKPDVCLSTDQKARLISCGGTGRLLEATQDLAQMHTAASPTVDPCANLANEIVMNIRCCNAEQPNVENTGSPHSTYV
jgi:hypothetical protein